MPDKQEIGRLIPFYLNDQKMSISELAQKMNVSKKTIYNWIDGKPMFYRNYVVLLSLLREYY